MVIRYTVKLMSLWSNIAQSMIAVNSTSLFVYCLFARMVGLFVSARYIMTIFLAIMLFILALNCQSREEHCPDKCPF